MMRLLPNSPRNSSHRACFLLGGAEFADAVKSDGQIYNHIPSPEFSTAKPLRHALMLELPSHAVAICSVQAQPLRLECYRFTLCPDLDREWLPLHNH